MSHPPRVLGLIAPAKAGRHSHKRRTWCLRLSNFAALGRPPLPCSQGEPVWSTPSGSSSLLAFGRIPSAARARRPWSIYGSAVIEWFTGSGAGSAPSGSSAFLKTFDPPSTSARGRQANPACAVQRRATTQERSRYRLRLVLSTDCNVAVVPAARLPMSAGEARDRVAVVARPSRIRRSGLSDSGLITE
jgi:hypothetical protein